MYNLNSRQKFLLILTAALTALTSNAQDPDSADYCSLPLAGASVCPKISELKYNPSSSQWTTDTDWKSTTNSFSTQVVTFLGSQWKGVQMGHLLCLYQGPSKNEFPISMAKNIIVQSPKNLLETLTPKGAQYTNPWLTKNDKTTITMDCYARSNSPCDCPWIQFQEKQETVEEVINSIEKPSIYPAWAM